MILLTSFKKLVSHQTFVGTVQLALSRTVPSQPGPISRRRCTPRTVLGKAIRDAIGEMERGKFKTSPPPESSSSIRRARNYFTSVEQQNSEISIPTALTVSMKSYVTLVISMLVIDFSTAVPESPTNKHITRAITCSAGSESCPVLCRYARPRCNCDDSWVGV